MTSRTRTKIIERHPNPDEPFCGLVFKIVNDQHGDLTYVRIYSGKLEKGSRVLNSNRGKRENISRMFQMHAADRNPIDVAEAGDIVACIGVKEALTGDTLCDPDNPIILERPTFPEPVISMSIEPKTAADKQKLGEALTTLQARGPDVPGQLRRGNRPDDHRRHGRACTWKFCAMRLTRDHKVEVIVGKPEGRVQGDDHRQRAEHPRQARQADPAAAVSSAIARSTSSRSTATGVEPEVAQEMGLGRRLRVREQSLRRLDSQGIHPLGRVRRPHGRQDRRAGQLSADQRAR